MTVEDCVETIKKTAGDQLFTKTHISALAGKRVGVDFGLVARRLMVKPHEWNMDRFDVVHRDQKEIRPQIMRDYIPRLIKFVSLFLSSGIDLVGYFDGEEKMNKIAYFERQEEYRKRDEEIKMWRERLSSVHPAQLTVEMCKPLRDLMKRQHHLQRDEIEYIINLLSALGIECYRSTNEAERLGSFHAIEGHIFALLSDDSDCFAHGCPIILRRPPKGRMEDNQEWDEAVFDMVVMNDVLIKMNMPYDLFLEFCICLGTDFSKRTYRKGPAAVMKELRQVGCIERLQRAPEDMKRYFHLNCRGHFRYRDSKQVTGSYMPGAFSPDSLRDLLSKYDLLNKYEEFLSIANRRVPGTGYGEIRLPIGFGAYNLPSIDEPIDYSCLQPKQQPTQMVHQNQPSQLQALQVSMSNMTIQTQQVQQTPSALPTLYPTLNFKISFVGQSPKPDSSTSQPLKIVIGAPITPSQPSASQTPSGIRIGIPINVQQESKASQSTSSPSSKITIGVPIKVEFQEKKDDSIDSLTQLISDLKLPTISQSGN